MSSHHGAFAFTSGINKYFVNRAGRLANKHDTSQVKESDVGQLLRDHYDVQSEGHVIDGICKLLFSVVCG